MKPLHLFTRPPVVARGIGPFLLAFAVASFAQSPTDTIIDAGQNRLQNNQRAQENVDQVYSETRSLADQYQSLLKVVDDLKVYNTILGRQIGNQEAEMASLEYSIANAAVIERQILPLLTRMLDSMEQFIAVDVPFLVPERQQRVASLKRLIENASLSNAEKTRRVFEAFQIENDYGNTIEAYRGQLDIEGRTFDVDFLRVGRVALTYRAVGADEYGYWDNHGRQWQPLTASQYKRNIDKGIRMARQEMAPELITVPITNTGRAAR